MKIQLTPTVHGRLSKQFTTLVEHTTGKPYDLTSEEAMYWARRAIDINKMQKGDENFTVKITPN